MRQNQPHARRAHTPVWAAIHANRERFRALGLLRKQAKASPNAFAFLAKQVGKDLVLLPLKWLHILIAGYQPENRRPQVHWTRRSP